MFAPPRLPNLNSGPVPSRNTPEEDWNSLGEDDRNTSPTEVPTEQLPEDNGFTPPDLRGRLPEGVYRRGPLTGPRRERPSDQSRQLASTPPERREMSHDATRQEDDPALVAARVRQTFSTMMKRGDSDQAITEYLRSAGVDVGAMNLPEAFAFRRTPAWRTWRQQRPNDPYPASQIDDRVVPVSETRQAIANMGDSPGGAFVLGAGDTFSFGGLDEGAALLTGDYNANIEDIRLGRDLVATNNPTSYFGGQIVGALNPLNRFGIATRTADGATRVGGHAAIGGINGFLYGVGSGDGDLTQRLVNGVVQGGIGTLLGGVTGRATGRAEQSFYAGQQGQEVLDAAGRLNSRFSLAEPIRPLPAHVGGPMIRRLVGGSEATLFGGRALDDAAEAFSRQTQGGVAAVTGTANPAREVLGEAATMLRSTDNPNGFANLPARAMERSSGLYDEAHRLAGGASFPTHNAVGILDDTIARLRSQPGLESPQLQGLLQLRDDLANGGISIQALRDLRSRMGTMIDNNDGIQRGLGKRMWGALSDDIDRGLRNANRADAAGAFRRADTSFRNALGHQERVDNLLAGSHEDVTARLINMSRTDARGLRQAMQTMTTEESAQVRSGLIQMLGRATSGSQDEAGSVFSLQSFLTNFDRIPPEARRSLFPGQLRQDLQDLATLARGARDGGGFRNNSRSGNAINISTIIRAFGAMGAKGGVSYVVGGLPGAAASAAVSLTLGRLLAAPGFAGLLVRAERTGMARAAVLRRLGGFASRNPHLQNDVQVFVDYMTSEDAVHAPEERPMTTWQDTQAAPEYYSAQEERANTPQPVAIETPQGTIYVPQEAFNNGGNAEDAQPPIANDDTAPQGQSQLDENGEDWSSLGPPQ